MVMSREGGVSALPRRALLVESEPGVRQLLRTHLELAGFALEEVADGRVALERLRAVPYDLIILDALIPNLDGVTLCRAARTGGPNGNAGIVMLSARNTESDRVLGLSSGADDYVTKPFGIRELLARIAAILRRAERAHAPAAAPHRVGLLSLSRAVRRTFAATASSSRGRSSTSCTSCRPARALSSAARCCSSTPGVMTRRPAFARWTSPSAACGGRSSSIRTTRSSSSRRGAWATSSANDTLASHGSPDETPRFCARRPRPSSRKCSSTWRRPDTGPGG